MEVENRLNCAEEGPPLYEPERNDQVIQRFTIFLTDEDENDLTIEESEEEKLDECDNAGDEPSCSHYNNDDAEFKNMERTKPNKKRGRKQKKNTEVLENIETEPTSAKKRRRSTFSCHHCSYISSWKTNLEKHLMAQHTGERPFKCPHCEYSSVHQFQLEKHWNGHHVGSVIHCHVCPFTTSAIEAFFKHFTQSHSGQKPHLCPECGRRAVSLSALELHIFEKHSSVPLTHECPHCPYRTVLSENLRNHVEALHKCSECDFWSGSLREVRRHKKKEHRITLKMNKLYFKKLSVTKNNNRHDLNKDDFENAVDAFPLNLSQKFPVFSSPKFDEDKPFNENHLETNKFPVIVSPSKVPSAGDPLKC